MTKKEARFREEQERMVNHFNGAPAGTLVRYWRGDKVGEPSGTGATRSEAYISNSGHAVARDLVSSEVSR